MIYEKHYTGKNYIQRCEPQIMHKRISQFAEVNLPRSDYHMLKRIRNRINLIKNGKSYGIQKKRTLKKT